MTLELPFVTLDVFTTERYKGNPLAVVTIPRGTPKPTQEQKQLIAREFNLSETVIVHDSDEPSSRTIDIFIPSVEIPFAGHPTIGTAVFLLDQGITTLVTKAGPVPLTQIKPGYIQAAIPHATRHHALRLRDLPDAPASVLHPDPEIRAAELNAPVFSIVRGMSSMLVELPSLEHLARVSAAAAVSRPPHEILDQGWREGNIARYYYVRMGSSSDGASVAIRSRMVADYEDPATGSAGCSLCSYLTLQDPAPRTVSYEVTQGVEMGRESNIFIEITTKDGAIDAVTLAGTATRVMKGHITV